LIILNSIVHHHNKYDYFCLADDIMEPLRPIIDRRIFTWLRRHPESVALDRYSKSWLIGALSEEVSISVGKRPLMTALEAYCASLRKTLSGKRKTLDIPLL